MLTDGKRRCRALSSSAYQLLRTSGAHITGGKDPFGAGLKVNTGHDKALSIQPGNIFEVLTIWRETNEHKNARNMEFLSFTRLPVSGDNRCQVIVFPFELDNLGMETHLYL
jgi:hypothetical protein